MDFRIALAKNKTCFVSHSSARTADHDLSKLSSSLEANISAPIMRDSFVAVENESLTSAIENKSTVVSQPSTNPFDDESNNPFFGDDDDEEYEFDPQNPFASWKSSLVVLQNEEPKNLTFLVSVISFILFYRIVILNAEFQMQQRILFILIRK